MSKPLRNKLIRLASSLKGSDRSALLEVLRQAAQNMPPKRKGQIVTVVKPSYLVSYYEGRNQVKAPAGTRGVVVRREKDYGGRSVALMDQLGPGYDPDTMGPPSSSQTDSGKWIPPFNYFIRFVHGDGSEKTEKVGNGAFLSGHLKVGR